LNIIKLTFIIIFLIFRQSDSLLFVADTGNNRIIKIKTNDDLDPWCASGTFSNPRGIAIDSGTDAGVDDENVMYITDDNGIQKWKKDGNTFVTWWPTTGVKYTWTGVTPASLSLVYYTTASSGVKYIADTNNNRILSATNVIAATSWDMSLYGTGVSSLSPNSYNTPMSLDVTATGIVYIADTGLFFI